MISPLYVGYALIGGAIQLAVIWLMREKGLAFLWVVPGILAHQYLFNIAYAKAPNFVLQWFITAALTGIASFLFGVLMLGDKISWLNIGGVVLVFIGVICMKLG